MDQNKKVDQTSRDITLNFLSIQSYLETNIFLFTLGITCICTWFDKFIGKQAKKKLCFLDGVCNISWEDQNTLMNDFHCKNFKFIIYIFVFQDYIPLMRHTQYEKRRNKWFDELSGSMIIIFVFLHPFFYSNIKCLFFKKKKKKIVCNVMTYS